MNRPSKAAPSASDRVSQTIHWPSGDQTLTLVRTWFCGEKVTWRSAEDMRDSRATGEPPAERLLQVRRPHVAGVGGELRDVQVGPHRGLAVEGALNVVRLVRQHFADADDEVNKSLAGRPVVADADRGRVDVGVEHRREHPALG